MWIARTFQRAREAAFSLFYPPHCAACGSDTAARVHLCAGCAGNVTRIEPPFCRVCSQPFDGAITSVFTCANCAERTFHFDSAVTRLMSRGVVRDFVHRFKYDRQFYLSHPLADWAAEAAAHPEYLTDGLHYNATPGKQEYVKLIMARVNGSCD